MNKPPDKTAGIKPPACRVIAFSWTGGFIKTAGGFVGRFIYGGFILNLAAVCFRDFFGGYLVVVGVCVGV